MIPLLIAVLSNLILIAYGCDTQTQASGTHVLKRNFCSGDLIFHEDFTKFDTNVWWHENSLWGGYNGEFQWYTNDRANSYTKDGKLFVTPTLTYKYLPCKCEAILYGYILNLWEHPPYTCSIQDEEGCLMQGQSDKILNPFRSARMLSRDSFRFRYGKVEVRAKMPRGEFLWPAVWMMPLDSVYGGWPRSGEIDIIESRGNDHIISNGGEMGNQQILNTLHFGASTEERESPGTYVNRNEGFTKEFHTYRMEWTPDYIEMQVDDFKPWRVNGPLNNGYTGSSNKMAPFDQQFYFIINLAVGATNGYFPDEVDYPQGKPWMNWEGRRVAQTKFWKSGAWKSYETNPEESSLQVDYIKVWAI